MNGAHDIGGTMGFGPVVPEKDEPVFHGDWEKRAMALTVATGFVGGWNIDQSRFARENVSPAVYLTRSYYEMWLGGLVQLLGERGLAKAAEIEAGHAAAGASPQLKAVTAAEAAAALARGRSAERPVAAPARFAVGNRVRARNLHPAGHTRLPRYVRSHVGTITHLHGGHVFPDTNAAGTGEQPQWLYTVRFKGTEVWGALADPTLTVSVDAWESYLEAAP